MLFATSVIISVTIFSLVRVSPVKAQADDGCPLETMVQSLQLCMQRAADQGFIDNQGVADSLLAKLGAAQNAVDRNQTNVAANQVQAFLQEVQAQARVHIEQEHADHMISHAWVVIQALSGPR